MNDLMTKSFLSYVELKKQAKKDIELEKDLENGEEEIFNFSPEDEENLTGFFQEIESTKTHIEEITNLLLDLQTLNEETKSTHSNKILRGLRDRMESNIVSISRKANTVKTLIENLEKSNASNRTSFKEGSYVDRTRVSITNGVRAKLREVMSEFRRLRERIFTDYRQDLKRKYFLATGEEPSDDDMEKMMTCGDESVFEVNMEKMDLKTKERHEAVNDIKRSLNRLHQAVNDIIRFSNFNTFRREYGVIGRNGKNYVVDLRMKTCSCKCFDIDRYPCVHAIAATMKFLKHEVVSTDLHHFYDLCSRMKTRFPIWRWC